VALVAGATAGPALAAPPARPNVLLVTLDTTRADHLGCYGARDALTPALDALAARGTVFEHAYSASPMTLPSHATMLTGLEPPEHGLRVNGYGALPPDVPTLATILAGAGYRTGAFVAAFVLNRRFGLDRGFATYDDDLAGARQQIVEEHLSVYRPGDRVVDAALAWLGEPGDAPFFAWVHLYDPHFPDYANPALAGTRFDGVASYGAEIAFMDRQIGRLLDWLDETGLAATTLVVAVADHGEGLGDHGEREHGYLLSEEVLRVPLLMALPGTVRPGHRVRPVVSSVDLLPTILDVAGIDNPVRGHGRSLSLGLAGGELPSMPSYAETDLPYTVFGWSPLRSITTERWKYVRTARPELYDRAADPAERTNLHTEQPETARELAGALATLERTLGVAPAVPAVTLDDDARRRLEALGYLESAAPAAASPALAALRDVKDMLPVKHLGARIASGLATGTLDVAAAIEGLRELVARSPESATFHARLGALLEKTGDHEGAAAALTRAVELQPEHAEARNNLGHVWLRLGRWEDAAAQLQEAVRLRPDLFEARLGLGMAASALWDHAEASKQLSEAVRLDPASAEAHLRLSIVLAHIDAVRRALEHAREAVRLAPSLAAAHDQLGRLLSEEGRLRRALEAHATAVRLAPDVAEYHDNLAAAYAATGRSADAVATARTALDRARANGRHALARDIEQRIALYERQPRAVRAGS
jgi:arylsulfatase A-like enzyme/Tfp pilus assembly protein PilF